MYFFWFTNKNTIRFTNHFDLGLKENSLKIDWDPVELSGKSAIISTKPRSPQNYLFWIDHLVGKSSFKRGTEVFSFYIIGEMITTNDLFVDLVAASCVFISIRWYDTNDNAELCGFIPFSKTITIIVFSSLLNIVFYWNNNLKLCFSPADTAVKNR